LQTEIHSCRSCGHGFSAGRGLAADRFCSQRCVDWFDAGNPTHGELRKGRDPYRVIASGNPDEIGKPLAIRKSEAPPIYSVNQIAAALGVGSTAISGDAIIGAHGHVRPWQDGLCVVIRGSRQRITAFRTAVPKAKHVDGKSYLVRLPDGPEAAAIRAGLCIRKSPASEIDRPTAKTPLLTY